MFAPLQWLLRIGGVFPEANEKDAIFAYGFTSLAVIYLLKSALYTATHRQDLIRNVPIPVVCVYLDCAQGIWTVASLHNSRHRFAKLLRSIFSTEIPLNRISASYTRLFETANFLALSTALVVRVMLRSTAKGEVTVLLDTVMCFLYSPQILQSVLVYHLMAKFDSLNGRLKTLAEDVRNHATSTSELRESLLSVFSSHVVLRDLKSSMVSHLAVHTVCIYAIHVVFFTTTIYSFIIAIVDASKLRDLANVPVTFCVVASVFVKCDVCHRCAEKVITFSYYYNFSLVYLLRFIQRRVY